jgi:hypothetical protein
MAGSRGAWRARWLVPVVVRCGALSCAVVRALVVRRDRAPDAAVGGSPRSGVHGGVRVLVEAESSKADASGQRSGRCEALGLVAFAFKPAPGLLFTAWHFDGALIWSALVAIVAIVHLLITMRTHRLMPRRLAFSAGFHRLFAIGLTVILV